MVKIIPYDREIAKTFTYRGTDRRYNVLVDIHKTIDSYAKRGTCYMALTNEVVAIGGIMRVYSGVGFAWLLLNENKYIKTIFQHLRKNIDEAFKNGYWRIQTDCAVNDKNIRLLEHLGFKREALMRKAAINGDDMYLYSIVKED